MKIIGVTPFQQPDVDLVLKLEESVAFPVISLGKSKEEAIAVLVDAQNRLKKKFGVYFSGSTFLDIDLPEKVNLVILSPKIFQYKNRNKEVKVLYQVTSLIMAEKVPKDAFGIIVKGNESEGDVGEKSSLVLFQELKKNLKVPLWVQGGIGIHSASAMIAAGARGVVLDSQLALFPECSIPMSLKKLCKSLDGNETKIVNDFRVLVRPDSPKLPAIITQESILPINGSYAIKDGFIPMGQDISLSKIYVDKFKNIKSFIYHLKQSIFGHIKQAKENNIISKHNSFAKYFNIEYPIAQGPMTRVSDVPEFSKAVADSGGLPFLALSLLKGERARKLLITTSQLLKGKTWGVGILGFVSPELRKEQLQYLKEVKPPVVLIAGGRPSQARTLEEIGIKTFLHVPSSALLRSYLKEGATNFVFEGRECGGHVGPLSSLVLWEKQIQLLLEEEDCTGFNILFAGGIHDDLSAAIVAVMSAPLEARGAKIGVLMGTSYLFTKEVVESGAILKQFQEQAIENEETVLLESGAGHVTRCLNTPFVSHFNKLKEELLFDKVNKEEIKIKLEELNVGRLRIASKGIERSKNDLVVVNTEKQYDEGLYMIGQVAGLRKKIVSIKELHENVVASKETILNNIDITNLKPKKEGIDIAIVGMACVYPGAKNLDEFWTNIITAKDSVTEVPDSRWDKEFYYDPESKDGEKTSSKWGGFIPSISFDPVSFGIPPQSISSIDPIQLLSLQITKDALDNAGYSDQDFDRENTSVIFGVDGGGSSLNSKYLFRAMLPQVFGEIPAEIDEVLPKLTEDSFPGVLRNVITGRIANRLNLEGRNFTIDAACASSLAAIEAACQELVLHKSNMVLAGGADINNDIQDYLMFSSTRALSKTGKCKTFDSKADGISLGEGVAVVVLKRLEDAEKDGNKIYSIIKGVGASSDGKSLGLTAPRKEGQIKAFERAYYQAGIVPSEIGLLEAHGTGTVVGDKTELSAMTDLMIKSGALKNKIQLGSVKTQIGHTKCASGMAGLIKMALSVHHGVKSPTNNITKPNKFYNPDTSPFVFNSQTTPWLNSQRYAGVSAFGFGGTNFHTVVENYKNEESFSILNVWPFELIVFRGSTKSKALEKVKQVKALLDVNNEISLRDIAYTLADIDNTPIQWSFVVSDLKELSNKLDALLTGSLSNDIYSTEKIDGKVAFMFSGQGSQRINMARDLFTSFPFFKDYLKKNPEYSKIIFPDLTFEKEKLKRQTERIKDTRNAQPSLGIVDYSLALFLKTLGINPDMVAGHSYGELPALCFANVFDKKELVSLSEKRANAILNAIGEDPGTMVAVSCSEKMAREISKNETEIFLANNNHPTQFVFAGNTKSIEIFIKKLNDSGISNRKIEVACAFHTPLLADAKENYLKELENYNFRKPEIPVWSNTSGVLYPDNEDEIKNRLANHLVKPVLFSTEVKNMYNDGAKVFIEVGPGNVLTKLVSKIIDKPNVTLNIEQKDKNGIEQLLTLLAQYLATGRDFNITKLFQDRKVKKLDLNNPEKYKLSDTTWFINGEEALPVKKLKSFKNNRLSIKKPLKIVNKMPSENNIDDLVLQFMKNMNSMVQAQKELLISYMNDNSKTHTTLNNSDNLNEVINQLKSESFTQIPMKKVEEVEESTLISQKTSNDSKLSPDEIKVKLLDIISEKTGYPEDMIGLNMDLEADLSIDSIKRFEIIGAFREEVGFLTSNDQDEDQIIETLASLKTIQGLIDWITENYSVDSSNPENEVKIKSTSELPHTEVESIEDTLLNIVSDKTGYPKDMLGLDMDLEADLSIDSIKRFEIIGELKQKSGILNSIDSDEDDIIETLASIKTLRGLIDWIDSNTGLQNNNKANNLGKQVEVVEEKKEKIVEHSFNNVKDILLEIVSDNTGYPKDMLGLDMDLEADLSIDSIKRFEIINILKSNYKVLDDMSQDEDEIIETLASIKTLRGLIDWISSGDKLSDNESFIDDSSLSEVTPINSGDERNLDQVERVDFDFISSYPSSGDFTLLQDKKIVLNDGNKPFFNEFKKIVEEHNCIVEEASNDHFFKIANALVFVDLDSNNDQPNIFDFFNHVQKLDHKEVEWIYVVTDVRSISNENSQYNENFFNRLQGYSGFLNSLNKEWKAKCKTIHVNHSSSMNEIAEITANELIYNDQEINVFYKENTRYTAVLKEAPFPTEQESLIKLEKESLVLVLGGAQGITAEILKPLSKEYPCHYVLVGRSPIPQASESNNNLLLEKPDIKKSLLATGKYTSPRELEKAVAQIYKQNQILNTIKTLESNGARVTYKSLDLKQESKVSSLIDELYETYGRIDGVIHGIGYLDDKFFHKKTMESFKNVFETKVTPIKIIGNKLKPDVQFVILFSSVASVMGNKGQVDYAAANSVLDDYSWELDKKINGRSITINWGPWKGKGMISETLEKDLLKRGVSSIPLNSGSQAFIDELKYGTNKQIILMTPIIAPLKIVAEL